MIILDEKQLRLPSANVDTIKEGGEICRKLNGVLDRLNKKNGRPIGVGLSANQVGIQKRVCIVKTRFGYYPLINPVIVETSTERIPFTEGCLSFPKETFETARYIWVKVKTLDGKVQIFGPDNPNDFTPEKILHSIAVQHEIGHTFGLLPEDFTKDYPTPESWEEWSEILRNGK